jgi:hypothetical protein
VALSGGIVHQLAVKDRQYVLFGHTREQVQASYDEMWHQNMKLGSMAMVQF